MADTDLVDIVQQAYPKLWHACHVEHRTRGQPHASGLTDRESGILEHIGLDGAEAGPLAQHLGIAKSTLSAHITRLEELGLIATTTDEHDRRRRRLHLTDAGYAALRTERPRRRSRAQCRRSAAVRYVEYGSNGAIPFAFREVRKNVEFRSTIDTDQLPFGGEWTITPNELNASHTRITIREDGVVHSALFRFVSRFIPAQRIDRTPEWRIY